MWIVFGAVLDVVLGRIVSLTIRPMGKNTLDAAGILSNPVDFDSPTVAWIFGVLPKQRGPFSVVRTGADWFLGCLRVG